MYAQSQAHETGDKSDSWLCIVIGIYRWPNLFLNEAENFKFKLKSHYSSTNSDLIAHTYLSKSSEIVKLQNRTWEPAVSTVLVHCAKPTSNTSTSKQRYIQGIFFSVCPRSCYTQ